MARSLPPMTNSPNWLTPPGRSSKPTTTAKPSWNNSTTCLIQTVGADTAIILPGRVKIAIASRETITIPDIKPLYGLRGVRTADLVEERITYKPAPKLLTLASDFDFPQRHLLRDCLKYSQTTSVTYRPTDKG